MKKILSKKKVFKISFKIKTLSKEVTLPFIDSNTCARQVQLISQVKTLVRPKPVHPGPSPDC